MCLRWFHHPSWPHRPKVPQALLGPDVLRRAACLAGAHVRPVAKLSSDFRALFDAQFKGSLTQPDAYQKPRYAAVAHDAFTPIRLRFQVLNVCVGELADSGSCHVELRDLLARGVRFVRNSTGFPWFSPVSEEANAAYSYF